MNCECRLNWECQECRCKKPKNNNTNTPARPQLLHASLNTTPEANISLRQKASQNNHNETVSSEDISILGDTIYKEKCISTDVQTELTLQNMSDMISLKLKENNIFIILEIKTIIQTEINKAIFKLKEEVKQETNTLFLQNEQRKTDIDEINTKIEQLKKETETLQNEIKKIMHKAPSAVQYMSENNVKKIVLYGLTEIYKESEQDLHDRIIAIFWDVLEVDLSGYIEDSYRIGRYSNRSRPLVIELISKKMTKYIRENSRYFQGTGLYISGFLDEEGRNERKIMRDKMLIARKKGQLAVIRNNQLFIEGELVNHKDILSSVPSIPGNGQSNTYNTDRKSEPNHNRTFRENDYTHYFRQQRTTL